MPDPLIITIAINIFIFGILIVLGAWFGYEHFSQKKRHSDTSQKLNLPPSVKKELLSAAEHEYQMILDRSARELQKDLKRTTSALTEKLSEFGTTMIDDEVREYQEVIQELRKNAETSLMDSHQKLSELHQSMTDEMNSQIAEEKRQLLARIDTRLNDALTSHLIEALQFNIDLGAQTDYILKSLEDNKTALKEAIDETHPSA